MDKLRNIQKAKKIKLLNDKDTATQTSTKLLQSKTKSKKANMINEKKSENISKNNVDDLQNRIKDLEILNAINMEIHKFHDLEQVFDTALDMTEGLANIDGAKIYLVNEQRSEAVLMGYRNLSEDYLKNASRIPYPKGVTWKAINSGKIMNIEDAMNDPDTGPAGRRLGHHGILGVPISLEEKTIGVVWFSSYKERKFDKREVELLSSIGYQIATAIAKANLYKELMIKNRYETIISSVVRSVHQSIDLKDVMENAIDALRENIHSIQHLGIYLVEDEEAVLKAHRGLPNWFYQRIKRIPYPKGFIWKTILEGESRYVADVDKDNVIGPAGKKFGTKSYLCVPICNDGISVGTLGIASTNKNAFDQDELKLLEIVAHQIEIAINNAQQAEALRRSEERYKILFEQSPVGVYISDNELIITQCNQRMVEILHSSYDKIIGLEMRKLKDKSFVASMEKAIKGEPTYHESYYEATTSSAKLWLALHYSPLLDAGGIVIGGIGIVQDVTERKQAEIELEDKKRKLLSTFNSLGNAVLATDKKGLLKFMNSFAEELFGWKMEDAIGLDLARVLKIRNIETNKLVKIPKGNLLKEDTFVNKLDQNVLVIKNRREIPIDIETSYIKEETGEICGIVLVFSEHSEMVSADRNLDTGQRSIFALKNSNSTPVKLMVSTSSVLLEEGVSKILDGEKDINIVARTADHTEVIPNIEKIKPDVLLFDTAQNEPEIQEIMTSVKKQETNTKVLLLLHGPDEKFIINATSLGVRGCLTQASSRDQLVSAIITVHNDEIWMDVETVTKILTRLLSKESVKLESAGANLTNKEEEVAKLVAEGLSNKEISQKLYISEVTVKTHIRNVFKKVGVNSRYQLLNKYS